MSTVLPNLSQDWTNILNAMASFENTNPAYNNPGGISYGQFAIQNGATGSTSNGIAIFPDYTTGSAAAQTLINQYAIKGSTIEDLINSWAPAGAPGNSQESTNNYINHVAGALGVPSSTPLSSIAGALGGTSPTAAATSNAGLSSLFGNSSVARYVTIGVGLIMIAGGLFLFKPTQEIVTTAVKTGAKAIAA